MRTPAPIVTSSTRSRVVLTIVAALIGGWAGSASAETKRVGVPRFDGPQEAVVRRAVVQVLKSNGYEIVGAHAIDDAAKTAGVQLDSNDGFKAVAKELSISSFVTGEVAKKKAKLTVRNGADGSVSGEGSFAGANPGKVAAEVRGAFSRRLGSAIDRGRAPTGAKAPVAVAAEPEEPAEAPAAGGDEAADKSDKSDDSAPAKTKTATDETTPAAADTSSSETVVTKKASSDEAPASDGEAPRALDISVGFRAFTRSLSYNDDLYGALRSYKLTLGPAVTADFILYPLAFSTSGILGDLGVEGHLEYAFGVSSNIPAVPGNASLANGGTLPTEVHDYWLGARGRIPFGASEVALSVGGGEHAFSFRGGDLRAALSDTPDTIYHYVRVGVDSRFVLATGLVAGLGVGYRRVLNQGGQISDPGFFPFLTVYGVDFDAKIGYQIMPSLEARLAVDVRRYAFAMHSAPADLMANPPNQVAGGAIDQYLSATVSLAYVFGGVPAGSSSSSGESASPAPAAEEAPPPEKKKKKKKKKSDDEDSDEGEGGGDDSQ